MWNGLWIMLSGAVGTYVLTFRLKGPMMPWIVFVFVMGQMSISQLIRQFYQVPDTVIDYTGFVLSSSSPDLISEHKWY
jgi:lysophospholipid acyltransferase